MSIPKSLTVTLTTHGAPTSPCVAACPELGLATDGPTVAEALHALARAIAIYEEAALAPSRPADAVEAAPEPRVEVAPVAPAEPRLRPVRARGARRKASQGPAHNGTPPPVLRSA